MLCGVPHHQNEEYLWDMAVPRRKLQPPLRALSQVIRPSRARGRYGIEPVTTSELGINTVLNDSLLSTKPVRMRPVSLIFVAVVTQLVKRGDLRQLANHRAI